jgi:hypothetical protein
MHFVSAECKAATKEIKGLIEVNKEEEEVDSAPVARTLLERVSKGSQLSKAAISNSLEENPDQTVVMKVR